MQLNKYRLKMTQSYKNITRIHPTKNSIKTLNRKLTTRNTKKFITNNEK